MLCRETTAVCVGKHKKHTLYEENSRYFNFYKSGTI
jgi:hypothetical protein